MKKILRVKTNPFHSVGPEGQPSGVVPADPGVDPTTRSLVGATIDRERTVITKAADLRDELRHSVQETRYVFEDGVIELPYSAYYARRIQDGELLAADAQTAILAGVQFVDPEVTRAKAKEAARIAFDEVAGPGAFDIENPSTVAPVATETASKSAQSAKKEAE